MPSGVSRLHTRFPCTLATSFVTAIPVEESVPRAEWSRLYHILTIGGRGMRPAGSLRLGRQLRQADNTVVISVHCRRTLPGQAHYDVEATVLCRQDPLHTPISWALSSVTKDSEGNDLPLTRYSQRGIATDENVRIDAYQKPRFIPRKGAQILLNWSLFAALGSLSPEDLPQPPLTLLDDMDQPKFQQQLAFAGTRELIVGGAKHVRHRQIDLQRGRVFRPEWAWQGGRRYRVCEYHLTGPGTVPWVFYTDEAQRLLFAGAGTEAYCLSEDTAGDAQTGGKGQ